MPVYVDVLGTGDRLALEPDRITIGGYTGRDNDVVQAHIDELAAIGIPPPPNVPTFYLLAPDLLTTAPLIEIESGYTSGEVEPVLIRIGGHYYLGVGSDHTDRNLEREDIATAKSACPKPLGSSVIPIGLDFHDIDWDKIVARSAVDGQCYQEGTLASLRNPEDLLKQLHDAIGDDGDDLVLFGGTLPLLTGRFISGSSWSIELCLADDRSLIHDYVVRLRKR